MSNIVVLVKQVPDTYSERKLSDGDYTLDREAADAVLDEINEKAVEQALQIKEAHGGEVTVLTVGPASATDAIRKALSMGADKAVRRRAAHGEREGQDPERRTGGRVLEGRERESGGARGNRRGSAHGLVGRNAVGVDAEVGVVIAHPPQHERDRDERQCTDGDGGRAPARRSRSRARGWHWTRAPAG